MRVREAQGNLVEALRVHDKLRTLLRDELGVAPGPQVQAEFERLLKAEGTAPAPRPRAHARADAAARRAVADDAHAFFATRSGAPFVGRRSELERLHQYFARGRRRPPPARAARGRARDRQDAPRAPVHGRVRGRRRARPVRPLRRRDADALPAVRGGAAPVRRARRRRTGSRRGRPSSAAWCPSWRPATRRPPEAAERYRLFDAASEVLAELARSQPVVLVLDDLHWADTPTLLMLRQIVRSADASPVLIVASFRDTERPAALVDILVQLRREHYFERIELRGLDEADAARMIEEFGPQGMPEHVNRALWEETKGNPFFLEEMVRHLGSGPAAARRATARRGRSSCPRASAR